MAAASLSGSSVPIFANPADEPVAVMVICPNKGSHQRLMQALNTIVPDAFVPTPQPETMLDRYASRVLAAELRDPEREDDTGSPYTLPGEVGN